MSGLQLITLVALTAAALAVATGCRHLPRDGAVKERTPGPPVARAIPKVTVVHDERRVDNYDWLREKTNAAVAAYLEAENAYTDAIMKPTVPLQEKLYREMLSHIKETDMGVPYRKRGWFYYSRTEQGRQYAIHCRKQGSLDAPEQVTLDLNELAKGEQFMALGAYEASDDGHWLAHTLDRTGFREYGLRVTDLRTGTVLPDQAEKVTSVAWAADNGTLFYTTQDAAKRSYRLWRHRLGTAESQLVYEEKDERFDVGVERSRSQAFLWLSCGSMTQSEIRFLPADQPEGEWKVVAPRQPELEYDVDHQGDHFYIRINDRGRNFRLVKSPIADLDPGNWQEVIAHRPEVMLEGHLCFARHLVVLEREQAVPHVRVIEPATGNSHRLQFPEPVYSVLPENNPEFDAALFRYQYESFITARSVFDYDLDRREAKLLKQQEVPGGYDPKLYRCERHYAPAADGKRIPVSLVYRKDLRRAGPQPLLLTGYGAYGAPATVWFNSAQLSLLDRGVIFALAHIRGGGDLGKPWHDDGRMLKKRNTFTDFIAASEFLVAQGFTAPDRLAIEGGSAGGLLIGAVVNMRPELFRAAHLGVPFVDVINTMLDESLPLTVTEFEEWGNPKIKVQYDYIRTYSPYDNLRRGEYPALLVTTSFNDSQVMYWEPAKYVAKLRTLKTDKHVLLLKTVMAGGHGGPSGRYDSLKERAVHDAFFLNELGIHE